MDRENSAVLWSYANEYSKAGKLVWEGNGKTDGPVPAYFLYSHAIELALKAYLRGRGASIPRLKKLGHDLESILLAAEGEVLEKFCTLSPEHRQAILFIGGQYLDKDLEYGRAGFKQYPRIIDLIGACDSLVSQLRGICMAMRNRHVQELKSEKS